MRTNLETIAHFVSGGRAKAIFALLYVCGLRRSEVVSLDLADYDPDTLEVKVRGKGNKERINYAEGVVCTILASFEGAQDCTPYEVIICPWQRWRPSLRMGLRPLLLRRFVRSSGPRSRVLRNPARLRF